MSSTPPPTPGLASSGVKPLSSAVKLGQAQSSSFQEKKDCLFFMNLVFSIRVYPCPSVVKTKLGTLNLTLELANSPFYVEQPQAIPVSPD
jgi:hypothetical protein